MSQLATVTTKVDAKLGTGTYSGKLVEIGEVKEGKFGEFWPFIFEIDKVQDGGDWEDLDEPVELSDSVTSKPPFGPKSKLFRIASAVLGRELEEGEGIDTDDIVGKRVVLTIEKEKKGDNSYSNIKGYGPWKRQKKEAAGAAGSAGAQKRVAPDLD